MKDATANPVPIGLLGCGMTAVLLNLHIAGAMEWKKNKTFSTPAFSSCGLFWRALVGLIVLPKTGLIARRMGMPWRLTSPAGGVFTTFTFVGTLRLNRALQFVFLTLAVLLFLLACCEIGNVSAGFKYFTDYEGIVCGLSAMSAGLAQVLNKLARRTVLPLGPVQAG